MTQSPQPFPRVRRFKSPGRDAISDNAPVEKTVAEVLSAVRQQGDDAVAEYLKKFDNADLTRFEVTASERQSAHDALEPRSRADTEFAIANVRAFAQAQLATILPLGVETLAGVPWDIASFRCNGLAVMCPAGAFRCCLPR